MEQYAFLKFGAERVQDIVHGLKLLINMNSYDDYLHCITST